MNGKSNHSTALWAGLTALFGNLAAVHVISLLGNESHEYSKAIAAILTSIVVAAAVYSKQRWDDAKEEKEKNIQKPERPLT